MNINGFDRSVVMAILVFGGIVIGLVVGTGSITAAPPGVTLDCTSTSGGAVYVADSGLIVYEADAGATHGNFGAADTVSVDGAAIAGTGSAMVRVDDAAGPSTCLSDVTPGSTGITISPPDKPAIGFESAVAAFAYRQPVFEPDNTGADLAFSASSPLSITIVESGLDPGTDVVAVDFDTGTELTESSVTNDGDLELTVPASTRQVDLREEQGREPNPPIDFIFRDRTPDDAENPDNRSAFAFADRDGDGQISRTEVGNSIAAFNAGQPLNGHVPSREEVGRLIAHFNQRG